MAERAVEQSQGTNPGRKPGNPNWVKGQIVPGAKPWQKGQSGNPGGASNYIEHTRAMALRAVPEAMQLLVRIVEDPKADLSHRIRAAETILERVLGKPAQS